MHYVALFITKCLLAREKVGALSAPVFAVLRRALYGDNTYSLGVLWHAASTLTDPRVKYMVVFMLLVWRLTLTFRYAGMIILCPRFTKILRLWNTTSLLLPITLIFMSLIT